MIDERQVLWEAEFNPKVRTYWLLSGALVLLVTVVGIPLLPFWFLAGSYFTGRYLSHMKCTLTPKTLEVGKGIFVRSEKTVPLDKITDLALMHGPIMRHYDLRAISVETAGQSGPGSLVKLVGIVNTEEFRAAVLAQRDRVMKSGSGTEAQGALPAGTTDGLLVEIRDVLERIEGRLVAGPPEDPAG